MKNATNPSPKMAKFVLTTCAACFARQKPVSTSANPACMKITSTALTMIHRLFKPSAVFWLVNFKLTSVDGSSAHAPMFVTSTSATAMTAMIVIRRLIRFTWSS